MRSNTVLAATAAPDAQRAQLLARSQRRQIKQLHSRVRAQRRQTKELQSANSEANETSRSNTVLTATAVSGAHRAQLLARAQRRQIEQLHSRVQAQRREIEQLHSRVQASASEANEANETSHWNAVLAATATPGAHSALVLVRAQRRQIEELHQANEEANEVARSSAATAKLDARRQIEELYQTKETCHWNAVLAATATLGAHSARLLIQAQRRQIGKLSSDVKDRDAKIQRRDSRLRSKKNSLENSITTAERMENEQKDLLKKVEDLERHLEQSGQTARTTTLIAITSISAARDAQTLIRA